MINLSAIEKDLIEDSIKNHKDILKTLGFSNSMVVGGIIRDALLHDEKKYDVDISTTLEPNNVYERLKKKYGKKCYISDRDKAYGTINIIKDNYNYDITTARSDVECFGREAKVEFFKHKTNFEKFKEDSSRRDFTVNAIYAGYNNKGEFCCYDFHNGIRDIKDHEINFIGNAKKRIEEDYLRIIRFFRFFVKIRRNYPLSKKDKENFKIIRSKKDGLKEISRERIRSELFKLNIIELHYALILFKKNKLIENVFLLNNDTKTENKFCEKLYNLLSKLNVHDNDIDRKKRIITICYLCYFFKFNDILLKLKESLFFSKKERSLIELIIFLRKSSDKKGLTIDGKMKIYYLFKIDGFKKDNMKLFTFDCIEQIMPDNFHINSFIKKIPEYNFLNKKKLTKKTLLEKLQKEFSGKELGEKIKETEEKFIQNNFD